MNRKNYRYVGLIIALSIAIIAIVLVNTICITLVCCPWLIEDRLSNEAKELLINMSYNERVEASFLSASISIIGVAIAVWAGLNIVASIDKKEIDVLRESASRLAVQTDEIVKNNNEIQREFTQRAEIDKDNLLSVMYLGAQDEATWKLIEILRSIQQPEIPYLQFIKVEQRFQAVWGMHESAYKKNDILLENAKEGIDIAAHALERIQNNAVARTYFEYRIADFHFYSGYCCQGKEKIDHFLKAVKTYEKLANALGAYIPEFFRGYAYPSIDYEDCPEISKKISSYVCNSIGEAYSKLIQNKNELQESGYALSIELFGEKAVFYCSYAAKWGERSVYKRNLGCAIERHYGKSNLPFNVLFDIYCELLDSDSHEILNFKVLLSIYDKYINSVLGIEDTTPKGRTKSLMSGTRTDSLRSLTCKQINEVIEHLKNLSRVSEQAKILFPDSSIGYQYECLYCRDICMLQLHYLAQNKTNYKKNLVHIGNCLSKAKKSLEMLRLLAPYSEDKNQNPMTEILRRDLEDIDRLLAFKKTCHAE